MKHLKLIITISSLAILGAVIGVYHASFYAYYLEFFKQSAVIAPRNTQGLLNGEVIMYKNGRIEKKGFFINGLKQGWRVINYPTGIIKNKAFFRNDTAQGSEYGYFKNGTLNFKGFKRNGSQYGDFFWYSTTGELASYAAYDIDGKVFCLFTYNPVGKITKMQGPVLSPSLYSINPKTGSVVLLNFNLGDTMQPYHDTKDLYITVAIPPGTHHQDTAIINDKAYVHLIVKDNTIEVPKVFEGKGIYKILIKTRLLAKSGKVINRIGVQTTIKKD